MRHTFRRAALGAAALLVLATGASGALDTTAMASHYAAFKTQQTQLWAFWNPFGLLTPVTSVAQRLVRHKIQVTGNIDPTNSPVFGSDFDGRQQILDAQIGITEAHATATGQDVVVAVLDSGFNLNHPWIQSRVLPYGYDAVAHDWDPQDLGNGVDDDQDGTVDGGVGHGTFVSGMIVSVAPGAWIVPVRVADDEGYGLPEEVVAGIEFAMQMQVDVINLSYEAATFSFAIRAKIQQANAAGILVVLSAGNEGDDEVNPLAEEGVSVCVGAVNEDDEIADFSNTPEDGDRLTLLAPGVDLYGPHGGPSTSACCTWSGTSFAAPLASGAAALALELWPTSTPAQLRSRLLAASAPTAVPVTDWNDVFYPHAGRIDLRLVVDP